MKRTAFFATFSKSECLASRGRLAGVGLALLALAACSSTGGSATPTHGPSSSGAGSSGGGASGAGGGTTNGGGANSGGTNTGGATASGHVLALPIELLGNGSPNEPVVASVELAISQAQLGGVKRLYVRCHRCGFYEAPEWEALSLPVTKVKASFRVLGTSSDQATPWVDITDQNVTADDQSQAHGGVYGGQRTVDFWVTLDAATLGRLGALPALNKVEFRFNGTDGTSNGYRVLDVDFQDENTASLTDGTKQWADVSVEKSMARDPADVAAGATLWHQNDLLIKSVLVPHTVHAACADCHAEDGRDLQYFNYSDNSIAQRSRFHGLSEAQGQQIAAYLRDSLRTEVVHVAKAAPWNPPYQPGPGLDCFDSGCTSNAGWAAGAGLEAVMQSANAAVRALFGVPMDGSPITQQQIDAVMQTKTDLNVRETPVAIQFPDWNDWLPPIHPMDVWTGASFPDIPADPAHLWGTAIPKKMYEDVKAQLAGFEDPNQHGQLRTLTLMERSALSSNMKNFGINAWGFLGGGRGSFFRKQGSEVGGRTLIQSVSVATAGSPKVGGPFSVESFMERSNVSLTRWHLTREWFLAQRYGLERDQTQLEGEQVNGQWVTHGEKRGWPWHSFSAFYMAPHVCYAGFAEDGTRVTPDENFTWNDQVPMADFFHSNQWYELQMTLDSGARRVVANFPMDWGYQTYQNGKMASYLAVGPPGIKEPGPWPGKFPDVSLQHWVLNVEALIKEGQFVQNEIPISQPAPDQPATNYYTGDWFNKNPGHNGRAQMVRAQMPTVLLSKRADQASQYAPLDNVQKGLFVLVLNGQIKIFNELYAASQASDWARCAPYDITLSDAAQPYDPNMPLWGVYDSGFCLDLERRAPQVDMQNRAMLANGFVTPARLALYGLATATALGAEPARLATWQDWADRMWPK